VRGFLDDAADEVGVEGLGEDGDAGTADAGVACHVVAKIAGTR
jgi:hypothetical protein